MAMTAWLEILELLAQGGPPIDDQEHIAERIVRARRITGGTQSAVVGHRVDAEAAEAGFPRPHDRFHFRDGAPAQVDIGPPRHRSHMRYVPQ